MYTVSCRGESSALSGCEKIIGLFYAVPSLVTVHSVETSADSSDFSGALCHMFLEILDESLSAVWVGITTIHEAVYEYVVDTTFLSNVEELIIVVE